MIQNCKKKTKSEIDEENIVLIKLFDIVTNKPIEYPIVEVHSDDYYRLFLKYCLNTKYPKVEIVALLNDQNFIKLINELGFIKDNYKELENQIYNNTNFKIKTLYNKENNEVKFLAETTIWNSFKEQYEKLNSIWKVEQNFTITFEGFIS